MVEVAHQLVAIAYTQFQELEADASGERLVVEAGYDPDAAGAVFERMKVKFGEASPQPANTPLGEAGQAVWQALGAYFRTHPPSAERARHLTEMIARNHRALAGRIVYRGILNYKARLPRSAQEIASEQHVY